MTLRSHLAKDVRLAARDVKGLALGLVLPVLIVLTYATLDLHDVIRAGRNPDALILALAVGLPALLVASGVFGAERREGTLPRLIRTPANRVGFLVSKSLVAAAFLVVQVTLVLLTGALAVDGVADALASHPFLLPSTLVLAGLAHHGLGLVIGGLAMTEAQAAQGTALAFLLMITLAGFLQPLDEIPTIGPIAAWWPLALSYTGLMHLLDETRGGGEALRLVVVWLVMLLAAAPLTSRRVGD